MTNLYIATYLKRNQGNNLMNNEKNSQTY
jgi:hypothetical protein